MKKFHPYDEPGFGKVLLKQRNNHPIGINPIKKQPVELLSLILEYKSLK
jgi:hypothetical protein